MWVESLCGCGQPVIGGRVTGNNTDWWEEVEEIIIEEF